jgi:hypothetical protein
MIINILHENRIVSVEDKSAVTATDALELAMCALKGLDYMECSVFDAVVEKADEIERYYETVASN